MSVISNAKDRPITPDGGTLPNLSSALLNWFMPMVFTRVKKETINFKVVETALNVNFQGVWQPLTKRELEMKPEGQRSWKWYRVFAVPALQLVPDEIIQFRGERYRVMSTLDYRDYGYVEYDLVQDFTGAGPTP